MAQSGDAFRKQHDISDLDEPVKNPNETPEDLADEENEGGEIASDIDKMGQEAGEEGTGTIAEEINKDEAAIEKDLTEEEQKKAS